MSENESRRESNERTLRELDIAGYVRENAANSLLQYPGPGHALTVPRKPIQKSISSHFRENISPTTPPAETEMGFPDTERVSPEPVRQRRVDTKQFFPDFDFELVSSETTRERTPTEEPRQVTPDIQVEPLTRDYPLSYVSEIEEIQYRVPEVRFNEPQQARDDDHTSYQAVVSEDNLLKYPPSKRNDARNWFWRHSSDWWLLELLSCLLSLLACAAIIIILKVYDDQPLSKLPHSITLNSLLALFTTLAEAGLMLPISEASSQLKWIWFAEKERPLVDFQTFDQASRGPLGGFKLLGTLKFRHLASIGAIISILGVATSPITQQIISYHVCLVPATSGALAQAPRSDLFTAYNPLKGSNGVPDLSMQQAVKMGLFNAANESVAASAPSCSTGNCTFPDFSSLAICSKVANITNLLDVSTFPGNLSASSNATYFNATLPNGEYLQAGQMINQMKLNITTPSDTIDGVSVSPVNHSLAFTKKTNAAWTTISNHFIIWQNNVKQGQGPFGAVEVLLYWCVNTYTTGVSAGVPTTTINSTSASVNNIGSKNAANISMNPTNSSANYTIDSAANFALMDYMSLTFRGTYSVGDKGGYTTDAAMAFVTALFWDESQVDVKGKEADSMQVEGVRNLTRNIAVSMTNNIRNRALTSSPATGTSWINEVYMKVNWAWLSFLLLLLVCNFCLLLATIIKTRVSKIDAIRSPALATLCGLSTELKRDLGGVDLRRMGEMVGGVKVRFHRGSGNVGWSLKGSEGGG